MGHKIMPRSVRAPQLENRTSRLKLKVRRKPFWILVDRGAALGYRRNKTAGTWSGRYADGHGSYWTEVLPGRADDFDEADGIAVLDYWQAQKRVREIGLAARHDFGSGRLQTVRQAVEA